MRSTSAPETTTRATSASSEINSEVIDIDGNDEHKRSTRSSTFSDDDVTPARAPTNLVDDDDYVTQDDSSGDRLQGSGEEGVTLPYSFSPAVSIPGQPRETFLSKF